MAIKVMLSSGDKSTKSSDIAKALQLAQQLEFDL
jgi:putative component of toxin-antitoxin plasmid stabilization module